MNFFKKIFKKIWLFFYQFRQNFILSKLIYGKKVLIVTSGPSAVDLPEYIPEDILIFACNTSPQLLKKTNRRDIALYIGNRRLMTQPSRLEEIKSVISDFAIEVFLFRRPGFIRKYSGIKNYERLGIDRSVGGKDYYYTKRIISPHKISEVIGSSELRSTSTGVGLLQYALFYGSKEIYLIGMDLDGAPRISDNEGPVSYDKAHQDMDNNVIRIIAEKYKNVFVASKKSPLNNIIPYKPLSSNDK